MTINSVTLYGFFYCSCIHESSHALISLHRKQESATREMEIHKAFAEKEFNEMKKRNGGKWPCGFGAHENWAVWEVELKD